MDSLPPLAVGGILEFGDTTFGFIDAWLDIFNVCMFCKFVIILGEDDDIDGERREDDEVFVTVTKGGCWPACGLTLPIAEFVWGKCKGSSWGDDFWAIIGVCKPEVAEDTPIDDFMARLPDDWVKGLVSVVFKIDELEEDKLLDDIIADFEPYNADATEFNGMFENDELDDNDPEDDDDEVLEEVNTWSGWALLPGCPLIKDGTAEIAIDLSSSKSASSSR